MTTRYALLQARQATIGTMPDLVEISRPTFASDSSGGQIATYATVRSTPGRISAPTATETVMADRLGLAQAAVITVPQDVTPVLRDRFVVSGHTYEVAGYDIGRSDPIVRRVLVREIV
ncbi:MAG: head-tail adaptor protein [Planctomycetota bacterium]